MSRLLEMHVAPSRNPLCQKHAVTRRKSHRMQHTAQRSLYVFMLCIIPDQGHAAT